MRWITLVFLLVSLQAFGATAVYRQGVYIDQYKIDDPGNVSGFHNNLIFISHKVIEVVRQTSSVNHHTFKESLLCWADPTTYPECPCDDDGQGGQESAGMCFLNSIMEAGGVTPGAPLSDLAEKSIYLGFWHEYRTKKQMNDMLDQMTLDGLNNLQKVRGMKFAYMSQGIDITTATSISQNWVNNGIQPTYDEYGLPTIPIHDRRLLKLFGEVGWFE